MWEVIKEYLQSKGGLGPILVSGSNSAFNILSARSKLCDNQKIGRPNLIMPLFCPNKLGSWEAFRATRWDHSHLKRKWIDQPNSTICPCAGKVVMPKDKVMRYHYSYHLTLA